MSSVLFKAPTGVEPVMEDLQSSALPLGYGAARGQKLMLQEQHRDIG